ncbi:hypothetical protein GW17_00001917 [Ensete ventricosum]|nr:hypothetical protein GW17_00001917 [Ensete ventricosum]RZS24329.1 hypothetical protein BHM03_00057386 [Ensete ventricosum]
MCSAVAVVVLAVHWVYKWRNPRCSIGNLPPGSMGLPLLGETIQFFSPNTTFDVSPFIKDRIKRYGPVFRTSLVGLPVVVSADPELNHFVFQQEGRLFESCYPGTFTEIFGRSNVGSLHGFMYKYLKSLVLKLFGPESLKDLMLRDVETAACANLSSWSRLSSIELKEATSNGRKNVMKVLKNMLLERRNSPRKQHGDFFDYVIEELNKERSLVTETIALDLMFVLLFASFETTSLALTLAIKFLTDHPNVLEKMTVSFMHIL